MTKVKYLTRTDQIQGLSAAEKESLREVADEFAFRANDYYLGLIDWRNPADPIRRLIVPSTEELECDGLLDACGEADYSPVQGVEHKYPDTAVVLVTNTCGGFCRFCFRKRLFMAGNDEKARDLAPALDYIRQHTEIQNVLLTGGDSLMLSTNRLERIIEQLRQIEHVRIIRLGTKMLAFNPYRVIDDPSLLDMIRKHSRPDARIYIMSHFNHPRELTDVARESIRLVLDAGAIVANQTPLLAGVNDDPEVLRELFNELSFLGAPPYYVFQCRPTMGNAPYAVPIEEGCEIIRQALAGCSGLARRASYVMSHHSGKIQIIGQIGDYMLMQYRRAADPADEGRYLIAASDPTARWLDDYADVESVEDWLDGVGLFTGTDH